MGEVNKEQPVNYSLSVGLKKGHKVTKFIPKKMKQSKRIRGPSRHLKFIREVVREIVGFAPYEKRAMELLKAGKDKRALKFLKKRLGGHKRGRKKRDELQILAQHSKAHQ